MHAAMHTEMAHRYLSIVRIVLMVIFFGSVGYLISYRDLQWKLPFEAVLAVRSAAGLICIQQGARSLCWAHAA